MCKVYLMCHQVLTTVVENHQAGMKGCRGWECPLSGVTRGLTEEKIFEVQGTWLCWLERPGQLSCPTEGGEPSKARQVLMHVGAFT